MSENGPKLLAYVDNGMVQRNVELQWYISDFANCNGTSQSWKNCNGTNPNIPKINGGHGINDNNTLQMANMSWNPLTPKSRI